MQKDVERKEREERAARLVEARKNAGHSSAVAAAKAFGWNENRYKAHESGRNGFGIADARSYADSFNVTADWLNFGQGGGVVAGDDFVSTVVPSAAGEPVVLSGPVAAGVFLEIDDMDQSEPEFMSEPPDRRFPNARRMAYDVQGDSMNALKPRPILEGDRAICVMFEDIAHEVKIRDGMVVVVQRTRDGGHTRERSVKQIEYYEDRIEFHPRSTNPKHKPIVVPHEFHADDGVQVEILGLVRRISNEFPDY